MIAPHPISYETLLREEPDDKLSGVPFTSESVGAILLVPVIVSDFYASSKIKSTHEVIADDECQSLIKYILNYHTCVHSGYPVMNSTHGAMKVHYDLKGGLKTNVLIPYGGILGACMLVFHFWVSLVVDACDTLCTPQEKHDALLKNADIFEGTVKSLEVN